ncbi:MAG: ABC transporter ATP-binding protein [Candidatus Saccharimonadales bacterium]
MEIQSIDITMQRKIINLFVHTAMKYKFRTWYALFGAASTALIGSFLGPYIISILLESMQSGSLSLSDATPLIIAYALTQIWSEIVGWRLNLLATWTMETAAQRDLYTRIFTALTQQSLSFHADRFGGALVSQTTKLIGAFERFWDTMVFQVMTTIASIVGAIVILSFVFWQYAAFLFVISILFAISIFYGSRRMIKRNTEEAQASTASNAHVADTVANVATIKSYSRENDELKRMDEKTKHWRSKSLATMREFLKVSSVYSSYLAIVNTVAIVAAIWASEHKIISIAIVYLTITYTFTVARQLWEINNIMRNYNRIIGDAYDMTEILSLTPSIVNKSDDLLQIKHGKITFRNVTFTHSNASDALFNRFNLTITSGERLGLVGHSGSGKTTLTKLLLRFSDIEQGEITIDGIAVDKVSQESLRRQIAYVPQEPILFHRSLRENIAYGKPDATDDEIREATEKAKALDFIDKLPHGLDTLVGERGVKLSGGQRQRIAIARAILKDAPILVLDEATSALDSESEKLIQEALDKLMKDRTSIVIAHRLSTIAKLDRIIVLEKGAIAEEGNHMKLLEKNGVYANLWKHQSGNFMEE